jgi:hypothetical protein
MADINLSPYTAEQQAMDRRRKMAEAMQQQAVLPIEMPTVPGAKVSHYAGLAKLLQGYIAGKELSRADEEQKAYQNRSLEDMATLLADVNRQKTIPGEQLTPAVPAEIIPAGSPIQENLDRKAVMAYNLNNTNQGMRLGNEGQNTFMPSSITAPQIIEARDLPSETTEDVIKTEAKPATYGEAKQVPFLSPEALSDPQYMKTGSGKQMLLQVLLQQKAQEQAAALKAQEIQKRNPEEDLYKIENGKYVVVSPGVAKEKNLIGLPNPSDFTPESLAKFQTSKKYSDLVPKPKEANVPAAAQNYEYYVKQENDAGRKPLSFKDFELLKVREGRAQAAPRERVVYDANRGGTVNVDTGEFKPVVSPIGEPIGGREKPLTSGEVNKITDIDTSLGAQKRLKETFDDKYAGYTFQGQGELANVVGSKFGGRNQAQAEWWAAHTANDNIARNALFGASLTAGEQKAWDKTSINPGMSPSMIRNRMAEREALIEAKRNTTVENFGKAGYDVKGFKEKSDFYNPSVNTPPISALKEGQTTTFANGQKWTLQNGKPIQVK